MVHFVGAGPGAADLITVRGMRLLEKADVVIYAGSLVTEELLCYCRKDVTLYDSALMTLEEVIHTIKEADGKGCDIVRLHSGDPSIYGAVREQMDALCKLGIDYDMTPGVTAAFAAASELEMEFTLPGVTQTFIITRLEGRTPVPEQESIRKLVGTGASIAIYLSAGLIERLRDNLSGVVPDDTPAAIVYKASRVDQKMVVTTLGGLKEAAVSYGIDSTAVILLGGAVSQSGYARSRLYDPGFTTGFRKGKE